MNDESVSKSFFPESVVTLCQNELVNICKRRAPGSNIHGYSFLPHGLVLMKMQILSTKVILCKIYNQYAKHSDFFH